MYNRNLIILIALLLFAGCKGRPDNVSETGAYPHIYPDYVNVTIPVNIAPLNFMLREKSEKIVVQISGRGKGIILRSDYKVSIPLRKWRKLLKKNTNDSLLVSVTSLSEGKWIHYKPFSIFVSADRIDPFLSYRLIEPGYEVWHRLSICERNLTNFRERILVDNNLTGNGCINCHTYSAQDPSLSFFHLRNANGGTIIQRNGKIRKIDTRTDSTISAGVYGSWHPGGRYIAFSTNVIIPGFHTINNERLEVYDTLSDVVVLDTDKDLIISSPSTASGNSFETFPAFSADGKKLYFCSAVKVRMPLDYKSVKYSLCSVDFDAVSGAIGHRIDTLISAFRTGRSVSEPKTSPDGRYILFTSFDYGNFPIWHNEADLHLIDLTTNSVDSLQSVNSGRSESYHSWSSDSRWFVFASKRDDGMYGKPYFSHIGADGKASKPFLLPQRNADFYDYFLKSFNIPELSKGPATFSQGDIEHAFRKLEAEKVTFVSR
jgi:hypothetical protein